MVIIDIHKPLFQWSWGGCFINSSIFKSYFQMSSIVINDHPWSYMVIKNFYYWFSPFLFPWSWCWWLSVIKFLIYCHCPPLSSIVIYCHTLTSKSHPISISFFFNNTDLSGCWLETHYQIDQHVFVMLYTFIHLCLLHKIQQNISSQQY